jgi:hypothetical protein
MPTFRMAGKPGPGHRYPGEPATIALLEGAVRQVVSRHHRVVTSPPFRLSRLPARPKAILADLAYELPPASSRPSRQRSAGA